MTYKYIDLAYLDTIAGEDQQLRNTLLEMVQQELSAALPNMHEAYRAQKWEEMHEIVHKLKSTLAFVGNSELTTLNQSILSQLELKNYRAEYSNWLSQYQQLAKPVQEELTQELKD